MNHLTVSTNQRASPEPWITQHIPEYARKGCLRNNFNSLTVAVRTKLRQLAMENAPIEKKKVVSKGPIWKKSWESLEKGNLIPYLIMVDSTNMWVTNLLAFFKIAWFFMKLDGESRKIFGLEVFQTKIAKLRNLLESSGNFGCQKFS